MSEKPQISVPMRSYSRASLASTSTIRSLEPSTSTVSYTTWPHEAHNRSSTPFPDDSHVTVDREWSFESAAYRIFLENLLKPPTKLRVRGMKNVPEGYISGHLVKSKVSSEQDFILESLSLLVDSSEIRMKQKWTFRYKSFRKIVREFFRRYCKIFLRVRCDDNICPVTCQCRLVKSFLNKRYDFENNKDSKFTFA